PRRPTLSAYTTLFRARSTWSCRKRAFWKAGGKSAFELCATRGGGASFGTRMARSDEPNKVIFSMIGVSKKIERKEIIRDISLSLDRKSTRLNSSHVKI